MLARLEARYADWRPQAHAWLKGRSAKLIADAVFMLPDMLMLVVGLLADNRIAGWQKAYVIFMTVYIISPIDLVPEVVLGMLGLVDDASLLGIFLMTLSYAEDDILTEHWYGNRKMLDQTTSVLHRMSRIRRSLNPLRLARSLIGRGGDDQQKANQSLSE
ncbi:MAG: YkvA family protein [Anaerolineales bacterium]